MLSEKEELEREADELRMKFNRFKQKYDEREKTDLMGLDLLLKNIPEHIVNVNELQGFLELERKFKLFIFEIHPLRKSFFCVHLSSIDYYNAYSNPFLIFEAL